MGRGKEESIEGCLADLLSIWSFQGLVSNRTGQQTTCHKSIKCLVIDPFCYRRIFTIIIQQCLAYDAVFTISNLRVFAYPCVSLFLAFASQAAVLLNCCCFSTCQYKMFRELVKFNIVEVMA